PSMSTDSVEEDTISNNFSFNIQLKNTRQLTDYFIPGLYISKDTKLSGNFSSLHHEFNFIVTIPLLQHYSKKWYNAYISGKSSGTNYSLMSGCNTLKLNNSNRFDNLTLISNVKND